MARVYPLRFGEQGKYELTEAALKHIFVGETAVRPVNALGKRMPEVVLSGGLHTWTGWEQLLKEHAGVVHLLEYDVDCHVDWFYARELQNGVITLKIPRRMFTGDAAAITRMPDVNYKSGYLWKTLYPLGYSEDDVIKTLAEALENLDREDSTHPTAAQPAGLLYGYALLDEPLKSMKLRIQVRGNQIQSAFPAWEQPATGNNGKPYSHSDSINFAIARSTVRHEHYARVWGSVFPSNRFSADELLRLTPAFILQRTRRDPTVRIAKWRKERETELMAHASALQLDELKRVVAYVSNFVCSKDPFGVQSNLYLHCADEIRHIEPFFNAAQLSENVAECIQVLSHYDLGHGTRLAMDAMVRFMRMAIVHTGGLNTLMFKRVLGEFVEAASGHHDKDSLREFFAALAASPCRASLYTEFDLNPFVKKNDEMGWSVIGVSEVDMELTPDHLFEFIAFNLGENYLRFSKDQRLAIAKGLHSRRDQMELVVDAMSLLSGRDFQFFMPVRLDPAQIAEKSPPAEDDLITVATDYGRMLVMYRQRVVGEDPAAYAAEVNYERAGTPEFFELIRQKHKRSFVLAMHENMLKKLIDYAAGVGYARLKTKLETTLNQLPREAIPLPKAIPAYLTQGRAQPAPFVGDTAALVQAIVGNGGDDASAIE
ncbi:hypothetical protein [Hydrogenophaga crocea]|uniref:Uncharacterized protein n=1 Tax=Hydrogenophaga crocea TaxID=2716225 RepID=A0A6G8IC67_9BURK|nr:hypothetical protein [Hydrogenophaga crocea]QIM50784.1 hypothetical protein G9Q37_00880 [Hydrogenophaga crocea]